MDAGHMRTFTSHDVFSGNPCLDPQDVADAMLYILGTPPHVQVIISVILWEGLRTFHEHNNKIEDKIIGAKHFHRFEVC
jgi:hypothetical protein